MLKAKGITKSFNQIKVLKDFDLCINKHEIVVLFGKSGSGKTTLMRILNNLEKLDSGSISIDNCFLVEMINGKSHYVKSKEKRKYQNKIGFVFQDYALFSNFTVIENLIEAGLAQKLASKEVLIEQAKVLLNNVGLIDKIDCYPSVLSGGQKQRVAIARALMLKPKILCFDEPTSALDNESIKQVAAIINEISKEEVGILIVSHNKPFTDEIATRVIDSTSFLMEKDSVKLQGYLLNPVNNKTVLITSKVASQDYASIALRIMEGTDIEQVGYIEDPTISDKRKITMMGNEFCANATRSYGLLLANLKPSLPNEFMIEISDDKQIVQVSVDKLKQSAAIQMPLINKIACIQVDNINYNVIELNGISHIIIMNKVDNKLVEVLLDKAKKALEFEALGFMFVDEKIMYPIVYVLETDTLIEESSCGSGSIAYAYYKCLKLKDGSYDDEIKQPGGIIKTKVVIKDNEIVLGMIDSKIEISNEMSFII